ncbi:MAG: serine hydrolase [Flavipsychrobacter sp.]
MRKASILLAGIFIVLGLNAKAQKTPTAKKIDTVITQLASQYKFSGSVLIADKGKVILNKGYGYSIVDRNDSCDENTYFQIGSITKTFTATTVLLLQQDSLLHVSDKISKYFPDYPKGDSITIEHLLTHTSGIYNYTENDALMQYAFMQHIERKDMMGYFKDVPLAFTPGSMHAYSNSNYMLLGYIIEEATGKTYYEVVRERIFEPLGMKHTGFNFANFPSWDKAQGYLVMRPGRLTPSPPVDSSFSYAAGAIYTTTGDLYKWAQAILDQKLLSKTLWEKALTKYKKNYGYGWVIKDSSESGVDKKMIGHNGGIHGFIAEFRLVPEDKSVIILLCNDMQDNVADLSTTIASILYNKPYDKRARKIEIKMKQEELAEYEGRYALAENFDVLIYSQTGSLWAQATKQIPFRILNYKKDHFFIEEVEAEISFVRNEKGKITHMVLHQNGKDIKGRKWQ